MEQNHAKSSDRRSLVFLGAAVVILVILSVMSFKTGLVGSPFRIERAVVCVELDKDRLPHKVMNTIQYGVRQVCLWFQYFSATEGSHLGISWYYEGDLVSSESLKLVKRDDVRAFYLLQEDGTPLPAGKYKVSISSSTKLLNEIEFEIVRKK